jgi:gliding motility-associated-like protein
MKQLGIKKHTIRFRKRFKSALFFILAFFLFVNTEMMKAQGTPIIQPEITNKPFTFYIPNAFTPNGDGINDEFFGKGENIIEYDMWIFDRWGTMIFHGNDINDKWDGKTNHGSDIAQQDVYVWKVRFADLNKIKHDYIGTVTLVK